MSLTLSKLKTIISEIDKKESIKDDKNSKKMKTVELNKNKSKILIHPPLHEGVGDDFITPAERMRAVYYPEGVINDPKSRAALKNYANYIFQLRIESVDEYDGESDNELIEEKKKAGTPEEKAAIKDSAMEWHAKNPINHQNIIDHYNQATDDEKKAGASWYNDAHHMTASIGRDTKTPQHVMAGLAAVYSPQTLWASNVMTAAKVARTKQALGGPGDGVMASKSQKGAAQKMLAGEHYDKVLKGDKIRAFAHLIEHGGDADPKNPRVCVDRHAYSVAAGCRITDNAFGYAGMKNKGKYQELSNAYKKAAEHISKTEGRPIAPHQLQATTWLTRQRLNEAGDRSRQKSGGSKTAGKAMVAQAHWNSYANEHHPNLVSIPTTGYSHEDHRQSLPEPEQQDYHNSRFHNENPEYHDIIF
jgi:hypothetical protein